MQRILLEVSREIIPDVTQGHLGDLRERGHGSLVLARRRNYIALYLSQPDVQWLFCGDRGERILFPLRLRPLQII